MSREEKISFLLNYCRSFGASCTDCKLNDTQELGGCGVSFQYATDPVLDNMIEKLGGVNRD